MCECCAGSIGDSLVIPFISLLLYLHGHLIDDKWPVVAVINSLSSTCQYNICCNFLLLTVSTLDYVILTSAVVTMARRIKPVIRAPLGACALQITSCWCCCSINLHSWKMKIAVHPFSMQNASYRSIALHTQHDYFQIIKLL